MLLCCLLASGASLAPSVPNPATLPCFHPAGEACSVAGEACLAAGEACSADSASNELCGQTNFAFQDGERVTYVLYYNLNFIWIAAGEVAFTVTELDDSYQLVAEGRTYRSYEWFFKVHDRYESFVDKETLLPVRSTREVHEGKYDLYEIVEYDQEARTATGYRGHTLEEAMENKKVFQSETCMHDVLSAIYFMRNFPLEMSEEGEHFPLSVIMDREEYPLGVELLGMQPEKKLRGLGKFEVYELAPQVIAGNVFDEDADMRVYTSTARSHVPLQIESPLSVGSVKAVLKNYENLRHEIVALDEED